MQPTKTIVSAALAVAVLTVASPASAHVDPDPKQAQAGSEVSVGFTVQHGCDDSPTVQLDMRLPEGVATGNPEPPAGWTSSVDGNVVTFRGGPLADDVEGTFRIRMVLPPSPDTTIHFPFVQRCEAGEIRWIDIPSSGGGEQLDEPAPAMKLFGPVATTTPTVAPVGPTTTQAAAPESTAVTVTTSVDLAPPTDSERAGRSDPTKPDEETNAGTLVFIFATAAVGVIAGIVLVSSRRKRGYRQSVDSPAPPS